MKKSSESVNEKSREDVSESDSKMEEVIESK
jgi:hypothetical protein